MRKIEISSTIIEYDSPAELQEQDRQLLEMAQGAAEQAYAPYSGFQVGAALLLGNGVVVTGNNQENIAYPSGLCAERVAVFAAGAGYPGVPVKAAAITCRSESFEVNEPISPCGACRQVLIEYEMRQGSGIRILLMGEKGKIHEVDSVRQLLPLVFKAEQLKKR